MKKQQKQQTNSKKTTIKCDVRLSETSESVLDAMRKAVVVKKDSSITDLFDITDKEWDAIAENATAARRECENMEQIARRLGIVGGGPLAVNAFLFGRMVESNESKHKEGAPEFGELMDTLQIVQKVKNDEKISNEERVTLLRNIAKLLEGRVKK
jgi:hypothetical protein